MMQGKPTGLEFMIYFSTLLSRQQVNGQSSLPENVSQFPFFILVLYFGWLLVLLVSVYRLQYIDSLAWE